MQKDYIFFIVTIPNLYCTEVCTSLCIHSNNYTWYRLLKKKNTARNCRFILVSIIKNNTWQVRTATTNLIKSCLPLCLQCRQNFTAHKHYNFWEKFTTQAQENYEHRTTLHGKLLAYEFVAVLRYSRFRSQP